MKTVISIALLITFGCVCSVEAGGKKRQRCYQGNCEPVQQVVVSKANDSILPLTAATKTEAIAKSALDEVNAARANRGLRPFTHDPLLTKAAEEAARRRASRLIAGHLPESDFSCLPSGAHAEAAGCAAWEPDWGWGACCTYDNYTYAGAAWVMGKDGRRYMHLFVR